MASSTRLFVVVSGPPGSGKSTLAPALAGEMGLAVVAKDTIKDAVMSVLPVLDVDASRAGSRHVGHFDSIRTAEDLWNDEVSKPVAGGWPLVEVDTTAPVDIADVARFVRAVTH